MAPNRFSLLVAASCLLSGASSVFAAPSPEDAVAVVDGVPVTRASLDQALEGVYGEQLLPQLIDSQLLANALKARGLSVSDAEVDAELGRLQQQEPSLQAAIAAGGARAEIIRNQLRRNLTSQKLLVASVPNPTPAQLQAFYTTYGFYYATPTQNKIGILATSTKARADQLAKALVASPSAFDKLVNDQKSKAATDPIAGQSTTDVGRFETPGEFATSRGIPPQMVAPITKGLATAKKGQVLPLQALRPNGPYIIVKVIDRKEAIRPTLAQLKPAIETDYKMAQLAQAEIKKNPQNPPSLATNVKQVVELISQPNPQTGEPGTRPSLRDVLTFILRPVSTSSLNYLRANSSVVISDPAYSSVGSQYKKQ